MKKRIISIFLIVLIVASVSTNALARWDYTASVSSTLTFTGTTANCSAFVSAHSSTATITATAKLIEISTSGSESTVKTWSNLSGTGRLLWSGTHTGTKGLAYRLEISATVRTSQGSEPVSISSNAKCP